MEKEFRGPELARANSTAQYMIMDKEEDTEAIWATFEFSDGTSDYADFVFKLPVDTYILVNDTRYDGDGINIIPVRIFDDSFDDSFDVVESPPGCITHFETDNEELIFTMPNIDLNVNMVSFMSELNRTGMTGSISNLDKNTKLESLNLQYNSLTGGIPSLLNNVALKYFNTGRNVLGGSCPDFNNSPDILEIECYSCWLTGSIPSFASNTRIQSIDYSQNSLTDYDGGAIYATFQINFRDNDIIEHGIDAILQGCVDGNVHSPSQPMYLNGYTNSPPSSAGLNNKSILESRGWTVYVN